MRFESRIVLTAYFLFEYKTPVLPVIVRLTIFHDMVDFKHKW